MKKTITVQAIWEFEVDTDDLDPEYVDTNGLAVDLTKIELEDLLNKKELVADDFEFAIINKK